MRFFPLFFLACLGLLTFGLYFVIDAFPTLDRPTSFAALAFVSLGTSFLILMDGVRRAKSGTRVLWSYLALSGTLVLMTFNLLIWVIGEVST